MSTEFKIGDRVQNIDPRENPGNNYGQKGKVVDIYENDEGDFVVEVQYDNGSTGKSTKPDKYYKKITYTGVKAGTTKTVTGQTRRTSNTFMDGAMNIVKRMTLTADQKKLIRTGLMTECGLYTDEAIAVVLQDLAAANVARLLEVATAMLADRKEAKEDAE